MLVSFPSLATKENETEKISELPTIFQPLSGRARSGNPRTTFKSGSAGFQTFAFKGKGALVGVKSILYEGRRG